MVGLRIVTARPQLLLAEKTVSAGNGERNYHAVANLQLVRFDPGAYFHYFAHELMAHNVALLHGRNQAVVQVKIRSTNTSAGNPDDCVPRVQDGWVGDRLHPHVFYAHITNCFHATL